MAISGQPAVVWRKLNKAARELALRSVVTRSTVALERLGSEYGGWWVPVELIDADSVCYSFGVGEDVTFDLALIERFSCQVWAFDPTPRAITYAQSVDAPAFHFQPVGVWSDNREMRFYEPQNQEHVSHSVTNEQGTSQFFVAQCRTTRAIQQDLGHAGVDLIKLDIEGAEVEVVEDLMANGPLPDMLLLECDHAESPVTMLRRVRRLRALGYQALKAEGLTVTLVMRSRVEARSAQPAA